MKKIILMLLAAISLMPMTDVQAISKGGAAALGGVGGFVAGYGIAKLTDRHHRHGRDCGCRKCRKKYVVHEADYGCDGCSSCSSCGCGCGR